MTMTQQRVTAHTETEESAIVFPDGLIGCPDWKRFVLLVEEDELLPVAILRSLDFPEIELLVTNPRLVDTEYLVPTQAGLPEAVVYCTLTVGDDGWITANLLGPLVIDPQTRQGRQVVLADSGYSARYPVARTTGEA
jgi:flagellar assembly factor FliW